MANSLKNMKVGWVTVVCTVALVLVVIFLLGWRSLAPKKEYSEPFGGAFKELNEGKGSPGAMPGASK